jgi:sec-independent protein translocase protein TatA
MGEFSILHWLVVLAIVVLLFGAGKLPRVMGDLAKGIKTFKTAMKAGDEEPAGTKPQIDQVEPSAAVRDTPTPQRDEAASQNKVEPTA